MRSSALLGLTIAACAVSAPTPPMAAFREAPTGGSRCRSAGNNKDRGQAAIDRRRRQSKQAKASRRRNRK